MEGPAVLPRGSSRLKSPYSSLRLLLQLQVDITQKETSASGAAPKPLFAYDAAGGVTHLRSSPVSFHRYPSPSGLGSRLVGRPSRPDEVLTPRTVVLTQSECSLHR